MMLGVQGWIVCTVLAAAFSLKGPLGPAEIDWEMRIIQTSVQLPPPPGKTYLVGARLQTEKLAKEKLLQQFVLALGQLPLGPWAQQLSQQEQAQRMLAVLQELHRIQEVRYFSDGGVYMAAEIALDGILAATLLGINITDIPESDKGTAIAGLAAQVDTVSKIPEQQCTGLVINGLGLGLFPTLSAELIRQDGSTLFARSQGVSSLVWRMGLAAFAPDLERARSDERIGNHPCVIRAQSAGAIPGAWIVADGDLPLLQSYQSLWQEGKMVWVVENPTPLP